jgi:hypothetical protein
MNILFDYRLTYKFTLHDNDDININKIIKSIKKLSKSNNNIFIVGEFHHISDVNDNCIYFTIQNNILKINFSHIFYDGYSIFFILDKIDQIYKDEIDNYIFNIYDPNYSRFKVVVNNIKLLPRINLKAVYDYYVMENKKNKKRIKILKTNFNEEVSTKDIIYYLFLDNIINMKNYCLIVNARKLYNEYENVLGNLVYFSDNLNKDNDIRKSLQKKKKMSLEKKLNNAFPNGLLVNSYLNFILPSFVKYLKPPVPCGNYIVIHPKNNDEKYILVDYYYY